MSILIKGMETPKKCGQCKLFHAEYPMYCMAVKGYRTVGAPYRMPRPDWCPIVEVKEPHGRLIDADKLWDRMYHYTDNEGAKMPFGYDDPLIHRDSACFMIENATTIIEAEESE